MERVPLDEIREQADRIRFRRGALLAIVGLFWVAGWAVRKTVRAAAYLVAAFRVGWREAGPSTEDGRRR
jgi:flagellar biogenesis protein FliO